MEKFALIIPTRGDRPKFLAQCKKLISQQTLQPDNVIWMDYAPESKNKDISQRYRRGVELATRERYNFVVFWEDDDFYHPKYLEWLIGNWKKNNKPDFFGVGETYYYHHAIGGLNHMKHPGRTSMFCTLAKLPWKISWPNDTNPFLDMHIFKNATVKTVNFPKDVVYAIGIKHGIGRTGGGGHSNTRHYKIEKSKDWFYKHIGVERSFYDSIVKEMNMPLQHTPIKNNVPKIHAVQKRKIISTNSNTQLHRRSIKVKQIRKR